MGMPVGANAMDWGPWEENHGSWDMVTPMMPATAPQREWRVGCLLWRAPGWPVLAVRGTVFSAASLILMALNPEVFSHYRFSHSV